MFVFILFLILSQIAGSVLVAPQKGWCYPTTSFIVESLDTFSQSLHLNFQPNPRLFNEDGISKLNKHLNNTVDVIVAVTSEHCPFSNHFLKLYKELPKVSPNALLRVTR
jgi:hypothetical protein